jgi:hypothetical protein
MRENRLSGSEGGATLIPSSLPLSFFSPSGTGYLREKVLRRAGQRGVAAPITNHPFDAPEACSRAGLSPHCAV